MLKTFNKGLSVAVLTTILSGAAMMPAKAADNVLAQENAAINNAPITITGKVTARDGRNFMLDYGSGSIVVEMDDWDNFNEANWINLGEIVTVRGKVDADFYERKTIEADNVYVFNRSTYYFANDADEEDNLYWGYQRPAQVPQDYTDEGTLFGMSGTVTSIDGSEFMLNNGLRSMKIETSYLSYNPLDKEGIQQIGVGDRVYVAGKLDQNFFSENEIEATSIVTLSDRSRRTLRAVQ